MREFVRDERPGAGGGNRSAVGERPPVVNRQNHTPYGAATHGDRARIARRARILDKNTVSGVGGIGSHRHGSGIAERPAVGEIDPRTGCAADRECSVIDKAGGLVVGPHALGERDGRRLSYGEGATVGDVEGRHTRHGVGVGAVERDIVGAVLHQHLTLDGHVAVWPEHIELVVGGAVGG